MKTITARKLNDEPETLHEVEPASKHSRPRLRWMIVPVLVAIVLSAAALNSAPARFFWIWLTWGCVLFSGIVFVDGSWTKATLLNLGIVVRADNGK